MPVAFISGAAQGIGRAVALRLADDGFDIAVNDLPSKDTAAVVQEIKAKGRKALAVSADVTSSEEVERGVQETVRVLGGLDVMVANAGLFHLGPFLELTPQKLMELFSVNTVGVFNCFKAAGSVMIAQGHGGRLIAASSVGGRIGVSHLSAYCATKFAVRGLVQSAAIELGKHGITVNCYCPGVTDTPMVADPATGKLASIWEARSAGMPLGRVGQPEDIANVVSFLASENASFITGQSLSVDGGDVLS